MKLRINAKLRAALIAAISTVGFTLTQAQAATQYSTPTYGGAEYVWHGDHWEYPEGTTVNNIARVNNKGGVMVIDNAGTVSNPVGVADTSDYGGVKVTGATNFTTSLGSWAGSIYVGEGSALSVNYGVDLKTTEQGNAATVYVDGTLTITGRSNLSMNDGNGSHNWYIGEEGFINLSGITGVNKGSRAWNFQLSVDPGEQFDLTGYTNRTLGGQLTKKFMSTGADLYGQVASFAVFCDGVEMDSSKYTINHDASGMSVTYDAATAIKKMSLTWAGGEAAWEVKGTNWTDAAGTTTSFASGDDVTFTGSGNKANVNGAIEAGAITVNGGTTIDTTADGASLTANSLTIGAGGSLTLAGTAAIGGAVSVADANALVIGAGSTLKVAGETAKSLIQGTQVANGGTVEVTGGMSFNSSATSKMGGTLAIAAGQTLTLGTNKDNQVYNLASLDALVLGKGTNIDTKAKLVTIKNLTANGTTITQQDTLDKNTVGLDLKGTTKLEGDLTITSAWKYKMNIDALAGSGSLTLTGGQEEHRAVIGSADINSITVTNKMNETWLDGAVKLSGTLALNGGTTYAGENGSLTVGGLTGSNALKLANGITFTGTGNYTYSGTLTSTGGQIVKQGSGSQTIGGTSLFRTIDVQAGTLVLNGSYAIDSITDGDVSESYIGVDGQPHEEGGFYLQSGTKTVYAVAESGANLDLSHAVFTYGGSNVTAQVVEGSFTIPGGEPNYSVLYVNKDTVDYTAHAQYAQEKGATITSVVVKDGATVDLGENSTIANLQYAATGITAGIAGKGSITAFTGTGALDLKEGAVLTLADQTLGSNQSLVTSGEGTLSMQNLKVNGGGAVATIGSNATLHQITMGSGTVNLNGDITMERFVLSLENSASTMNIGKGANVHVTGTKLSVSNSDASFMVSNWNQVNTLNIEGRLIAEAGISTRDGKANINVKDGGTLELHQGLLYKKNTAQYTNINVESGGTLLTAGNTTDQADQGLNVNLNNGSTLQGYYAEGVDTAAIAQALTLAGTVTFDAGAAGKTLQLNSNIAGEGVSIVKTGEGALVLNGNANALYNALNVQEGTIALNGTFDLSGITHAEGGVEYYETPTGPASANGFAKYTGEVQLADANYGSVSVGPNAALTLDGWSVSYDASTGKAGGSISLAAYYLNSDGAVVDLNEASSIAQGSLATIYVKGASGTVTADSDVSLATLNVASGSAATIAGDGTVTLTTLSNSGTLNVAGSLTMASALALPVTDTPAIQVQSGGVLSLSTASTIGGQGLVNGTDGEQGNSAAFSNLFQGKAVSVADGGQLVMRGNIVTTDHGGGEMNMALSSLKVEGKLTVNTWSAANYKLNGHSLEVTDNLWLKNHQDVTVGNGSLTVGGQLQISHEGNNAGGQYKVAITAGAGNVTLGSIGLYGGGNTMSLDGTTLTFTSDAGNVINKLGTAGNDNTVITLANTKLVADASSWTLAPITGVTVAMTGVNTIDVAAGKAIDLTVSTLNGAVTKTGEGSLVFTAAGVSRLSNSIKVQQGALTLNGTYAIDDITEGTIVEKYIGADGQENPNGGFYMQTGTKTVYSVAADIASINVAGAHFTYDNQDVTASVLNGSYELAGTPIKTTLWVNTGKLAYDDYYAASDGALTTAKVAAGATLEVGEHAVGTLAYQTSGTTIGLAGTGTVDAISGTGILNMAEGARVSVPDVTVSNDRGIYSTGAGTLVMNALYVDNNASRVEFDSATEIALIEHTGGTITFGGEGNTHSVTDLKLSMRGGRASTVNVAEGATLHITGTEIATAGGGGSFAVSHWNSGGNTINVNGTLISEAIISGWDGEATINVENGGTLELHAGLNRNDARNNAINLNIKSGATLVAGTATTGVNKDSVHVNLNDGSTLKGYYGEGDTATIAKALTFSEGIVTFDVESGKTLQLDSNIATEGLTISKIGGGVLALNGNANVLYNTIDLQAGTLALNGTFDVSNISHTQGTVEYYATPDAQESSANGFAKYTGEAQLVDDNYGNVTVGDNAVITLDGYAVGYNDTTGTVGGTISLATYYINRDSERLSVIQGIAPNAGVALADGAKLVMDADLSAALTVAAGGKGYVEIGEGQLLHSTTAAVELSGSGTYALASGSPNMGNVTLDATNWTGIVMVSGWSQTIFDYATGLSTANSYVGMNGVTGVDSKWNAGDDNWQTLNFYLEDPDGGVAWNWNNGAGGGATARFAGKMAGSGTLKKTDGNHSNSFYFKGDVSEWTGRFEVSGESKSNAFVQFTGDATNIAVTVENSSDKLYGLQIINDSDVTMSGDVVQTNSGTIALTVGADTTFSREVDSVELSSVHVASLTVNAGKSATFLGTLVVDGAVNVGEGSTLTLSGDTTINQAITSTGTVVFNQNLAVSGFEVFADAGYIDYDGSYSATGNGFTGVGDSYITLVSGGTVVGNIDVTQGVEQEAVTYHLTNSGNAVLADSHHRTGDTYHLNSGDVNISTITAAGATAIAVTGGTLVVDQDASAITIDVTGEGTISDEGGHVSPTQVGIAAQAEATFEQGIDDTENGVRFSSDEGGVIVKNTNGELGGEDIHYSIDEASAQVTADKLTFTGVAPTTVANQLEVDEIVNATRYQLTLENAENLELKSMTIGDEATIAVYTTDETAAVEGTVTITESLVAGGGTLLADLTLVGHGGEQLLYWDLNGAGRENALTLGSVLTLNTETGLIQLDDTTMQQIAALGARGEFLELVLDAGTGLEYIGDGWFDGVFSRTYTNAGGEEVLLGGDYNVQLLENGNFGIVKFSNVPEPTTGTLSLLALAALAARRRKH
ncbi:MAG: hypothetical protein Q4C88_01210 [Akkermansia sp.]|nr:hypothetical protein [Akkermansia sp.]